MRIDRFPGSFRRESDEHFVFEILFVFQLAVHQSVSASVSDVVELNLNFQLERVSVFDSRNSQDARSRVIFIAQDLERVDQRLQRH